MKRVEMKIDFKSSVEEVFKIVSNMDDCSWRSDLSKVKKVDITHILSMIVNIMLLILI